MIRATSSLRQFVIPCVSLTIVGAMFMHSGLAEKQRSGDILVALTAWAFAVFLALWHFKVRNQPKSVRLAAAGAFALVMGFGLIVGWALAQIRAGYHGIALILVGTILLTLGIRSRLHEKNADQLEPSRASGQQPQSPTD